MQMEDKIASLDALIGADFTILNATHGQELTSATVLRRLKKRIWKSELPLQGRDNWT